MAPKIAIAIFSLAFIGAVFAGFKCYECDGGENCKDSSDVSDKIKTVECNDASFCYTAKKGDKYPRGCESYKNAVVKNMEDGWKYVMVCGSDRCNVGSTQANFTCLSCGNCRNVQQSNPGSINCTNTAPFVCTTVENDDSTVTRGCIELSKLEGIVTNVKQVCASKDCNKMDFQPAYNYTCVKCTDCTQKTDVENCYTSNVGCFTKINGKTVERGCSPNPREWEKTKNDTDTVKGTLHKPCMESFCNNETLYKCTSCKDKETCKEPKDEYVICASTTHGCYTQLKDNDTVKKGCADNAEEWKKLQEDNHKVTEACKKDFCNKYMDYKCYGCSGNDCKTIGEKTPKVDCSTENTGCYTIVKADEAVRGCAHNQSEWDNMIKDIDTKRSEPCKIDSCNNQKIFDCYSCHDDKKCKKIDDKDNSTGIIVCMDNYTGCYSVFNGEDTIRGCAKNQTEIDSLKKDKGEAKGPCKENKCNKDENPNASPGIQGSPTMIISIVAVFGAYLMNY